MKEEKAGRFFCSLFYCVNQTEKPLFSAVVFLLQLAPSDGYRRHLPRQAGTAYVPYSFLYHSTSGDGSSVFFLSKSISKYSFFV